MAIPTNNQGSAMSTSSRIKNLLNHKSDLQVLSLRLKPELINKLDEYSQIISALSSETVTRSGLIETFIQGGIEELEKQLAAESDDDVVITTKDNQQEKQRFFLLNTNFNNDDNDHYKMLEDGEASAFYGDWKINIENLKEGDIVFLYQSGHGIVGYGNADAYLDKREHHGKPAQCYTRKLNDFVRLDVPVSARKCKEITKTNFNYRMVMVSLTKAQGEALLNSFKA